VWGRSDPRGGGVTDSANVGRVAIILPPGGQLAYPTLAPASLKGYLRSTEAVVDLVDLNVVGFHDLLSDGGLDLLRSRVSDREQELGVAFADQPEVLHQLRFFLELTEGQRDNLRHIPQRVRDLAVFCHETAYVELMHHLALCVRLVELAFHPLRFLPGSLIGGMFGRIRDFGTLMSIETPYDASIDVQLAGLMWPEYQVIGLSAFSFDQLIFALRLSSTLRALAPQAVTILGGNTLCESEIPPKLQALLADAFDVVVVGDGELPLLRTVEYARGVGGLEDIPNAFYRRGEEIVDNGRTYRYQFEADCAPDFDDFPHDLYQLPVPILPFRFSNGCEWGRCTFCCESADRGIVSSRLTYREAAGDQVATHLSELHEKYGASIFINCSSLVTASGCAEIADALKRHKLPFQWFGQVRAEKGFTAERIAEVASGGASTLNFGVESFTPRVNRIMRKGMIVNRAPGILGGFRQAGATVTCYTMANFPTETLDEYREHLSVVEREFDTFDVLFKSNFMLVTDAPVFHDPTRYALPPDLAENPRYQAMRDDVFPIYVIPDEESADADFRWPGDQLEEKLDSFHRMLLRLAMRRPLYFARHYEIVSHGFFWEPEYNMIVKQVGIKRFLPPLSLADFIDCQVDVTPEVEFERVTDDVTAVTVRDRTIRLYFGPCVTRLLELLAAGTSFRSALDSVVRELDPTPLELIDVYEQVHRDLRHLGVLEVTPPAVRSELTGDALPVGSGRAG
jgi:Radical SAM superfamily